MPECRVTVLILAKPKGHEEPQRAPFNDNALDDCDRSPRAGTFAPAGEGLRLRECLKLWFQFFPNGFEELMIGGATENGSSVALGLEEKVREAAVLCLGPWLNSCSSPEFAAAIVRLATRFLLKRFSTNVMASVYSP